MLRDSSPNEPQHTYLVPATRFLVVENVEEPVGTRGYHGNMLKQFEDVR